jgi:hypothetical protein
VERELAPFNCECRAYGALKAAGCESAAVKTYGYMFLDDENEETIRTKFGVDNWYAGQTPLSPGGPAYSSDDDSSSSGSFVICRQPGERIKAIVKEYIDGDCPFTPPQIPKMIRNLIKIYDAGVIDMDIEQRNYVNGVLVDFSVARTVPNMMLDYENGLSSDSFIKEQIESPAAYFDGMIDEWNESEKKPKIMHRIFPNMKYLNILRKPARETHAVLHRFERRLRLYCKKRHQPDSPISWPPHLAKVTKRNPKRRNRAKKR